jgi:hypothetical protein
MIGRRIVREFLCASAMFALFWPAVPCIASGLDCVRFSGHSGEASVLLERGYVLSGVLPVTLCGIERGVPYRITIDGPEFERRIGSFTLEAEGGRVGGIRLGIMARNAVLPGWGAVRAERAGAAAADIVSLCGAIAVLAGEQQEYWHVENRLEVLQTAASNAITYEEKMRAVSAEHDASRSLNIQNRHRRRLALLCGALYGWQVIEPLFADAPPVLDSGPDRLSLVLSGTGRSRAKAFIYSFIRPGRGQFYQGKTTRGLAFSSASIAAALCALEFQNRYDEASGTYELCVERFNVAGSVPEKESLAEQCASLREDADTEKSHRDTALIALAVVWGINVADVFFDSNDGGASPVTLELTGRGAALAVRF